MIKEKYNNRRKKRIESGNEIVVSIYLIKRNPLGLVVAPLQPGNMFSQSGLINDSRLKAKSKKRF